MQNSHLLMPRSSLNTHAEFLRVNTYEEFPPTMQRYPGVPNTDVEFPLPMQRSPPNSQAESHLPMQGSFPNTQAESFPFIFRLAAY